MAKQNSAIATLSADTLGDLDEGRTRAVIDRAIANAIADLEDRGGDQAARKVTIELKMIKLGDGEIEIACDVTTKVPSYKVYPTRANLRQVGRDAVGAIFSKHAADNPDQKTILDEVEDE